MAETLIKIPPIQSTQQCAGQLIGLYWRDEMASCFLPATTARKHLPPPLAPAGKRLWPDVQALDQLLPAFWCQPMFQSGDQGHHYTQVNLSTEKTYGGRGAAAPAIHLGTTETQAGCIGFIQVRADTTRLAWITGTVQNTTTRTTFRLNLTGDVLIYFE